VYDGQFYAQRALDPLVRDPQVDHAMDLAPFRARRILFSWTAYVIGLGRPAWILEVYALQNVAAWLILAALLSRWMPPGRPRGLLAWAACLLSHGLLWSVRFALLDGPSLALTVWADQARRGSPSVRVGGRRRCERARPRDQRHRRPSRSRCRTVLRAWGRLFAAVVIVLLPILIWEDYLRSIYRSTIMAGADGQVAVPGVVVARTVAGLWRAVRAEGLWSARGLEACVIVPLLVQAAFVATRPQVRDPWWRVAAGYVVLMLIIDRVLWAPSTGAITRVMLPLTVGFNALLMREPRPGRFWPWFVGGNLHVIPGLWGAVIETIIIVCADARRPRPAVSGTRSSAVGKRRQERVHHIGKCQNHVSRLPSSSISTTSRSASRTPSTPVRHRHRPRSAQGARRRRLQDRLRRLDARRRLQPLADAARHQARAAQPHARAATRTAPTSTSRSTRSRWRSPIRTSAAT
jgi:hypothetical protein